MEVPVSWHCDGLFPVEPLVLGDRVFVAATEGELRGYRAKGRDDEAPQHAVVPRQLDETHVIVALKNADTSLEEILCLDVASQL